MKKIKNYFIALLVGTTLSLGSCTNLDEIVYSELTDENLTGTEAELASMTGSLYVQLRFLYWAWEGYFDINEESSDCYMTPYRTYGGWGAQYINLHENDPYTGIPHLYQEWYYSYNAITKANTLLENEIIKANPQAVAEIRALRVMFYYIVFDLWRNIPLEDKISTEKGYLPVQAAPEYIWDFMITELEAVIPELTTEKVFGKMNKYVASMIAAKVYLNHDAWLKGFEMNSNLVVATERNASSEWFKTNAENDNKWYKKAFDHADVVVKEGGYSLATNYLDNTRCKISGSPEVILALPLDGVKASHNYLVNKCYAGPGGKVYGYNGTPWNGSCAVPQFIQSYDPDDKRLTDTWAFGQQYYYGTTDPIYMADASRVAAGDPEALTAEQAAEPMHVKYGHKVGDFPLKYTVEVHSIKSPGAYDMEGARFQKYEVVAGKDGTYGDDVCFFRLADAMFIKAEVLLRIGAYQGETKEDAATLISRVRERSFANLAKATRTVAQLEANSNYPYGIRECTKSGSKNPYADFKYDEGSMFAKQSSYTEYTNDNSKIILGGLLDDLGWEFAGEHHRRQDLMRFTLENGQNVYNGKTWFCRKTKSAINDHHNNVFPIYAPFIQANVKLKQNYGFSDTTDPQPGA